MERIEVPRVPDRAIEGSGIPERARDTGDATPLGAGVVDQSGLPQHGNSLLGQVGH